jgi:hypothetical protein
VSREDWLDDELAEHLRTLELALLDPAVRRDRANAAGLLAEDFFEYGSSGRVWLRAETLELLATEDYTPLEMEDFRCDRIAADVALVTYRSVRRDIASGETAVALRSSLWVREASGWRVRFHQGTKVLGTKA